MCGRFLLLTSRDEVAQLFDLNPADVPELLPRYNVAPTQNVPAVRLDDGHRTFAELRWGLIPSWAKDAKIANGLINARAETVAEKPAFRSAFKSRRCLLPASGFYEWLPTGGRHKQPYHFHQKDGRPFAFAGLWERWHGEDDAPVETCTIITAEANELVWPVHERMPAILPPGDFAAWLDPQTPAGELPGVLRPYPAAEMAADPANPYVNSPRNQGPKCLAV
jgi:putative SOS response-associated peptidase YedK